VTPRLGPPAHGSGGAAQSPCPNSKELCIERVSRSHGKCYFRTAGDERRGQEFPQHPAQGDHDRVVRYWRLPLSDDDALRTRDVIFQCLGTHACGLFIHSGHQFIHRIAPHFQIQLGDVTAVRQLDLQEPRVAPAILEQAHCPENVPVGRDQRHEPSGFLDRQAGGEPELRRPRPVGRVGPRVRKPGSCTGRGAPTPASRQTGRPVSTDSTSAKRGARDVICPRGR
jgi:hypothetical protein